MKRRDQEINFEVGFEDGFPPFPDDMREALELSLEMLLVANVAHGLRTITAELDRCCLKISFEPRHAAAKHRTATP